MSLFLSCFLSRGVGVPIFVANGRPTGGYLIAMDTIGAGSGETVLILDEGTGARQILDDANAPVRSVIVGIVDAVEIE